jgi:hypothetical protein
MKQPIRHIGRDRLAGSSGENDEGPPKSELEAEQELLEEYKERESDEPQP